MRLTPTFLNAPIAALLSLCCLIPQTAGAVTLNFSAVLTNGTCSLSVDKGTLSLPSITLAGLQPQRLYSTQPFTLSITECTGGGTSGLTPVVAVAGAGESQDSKWLFRQPNSTPGVGVMVFKSDVEPTFNTAEIGNGATIPVGAVGANAVAQKIQFYAAASCLSAQSCADVAPGTVTANLMFIFTYK